MLMGVFWTASSFNYYLMSFFLKYIPGNIYENTSISSGAEITAYITSGYIIKVLGFRISYIIAFAIATSGGVLMVIFQNDDNMMAVFVLLSKLGIAFAFNNSYLATPRLFPVALTGTAFGLCNVLARFCTVLSPLVAEIAYPMPMIIFASISGISAVLAIFLQTPPSENDSKVSE